MSPMACAGERAKANGLRAVVAGGACRPVCVERSVNWLGLAWNRSRAAGCARWEKGAKGTRFSLWPSCDTASLRLRVHRPGLRAQTLPDLSHSPHVARIPPPPPAPLAPVPAHHPSAVHPISSPRQRLITTHISVSHRLSHHHQTHTQHLHSTKTLLIPVTTSYPFPFFSLRL